FSFRITTGGAPTRSRQVKSRPDFRGMRKASKNPGVIVRRATICRSCKGGNACPSAAAGEAGPPPTIGRPEAAAACVTPGTARGGRESCSRAPARGLARRKKAKEHAREQRQRERKSHHPKIEAQVSRARNEILTNARESIDPPDGEEQPEHAGDARGEHALR